MNLPCEPVPAARTVAASFIAAIAAGHGTPDLRQITVAVALPARLLTWLGRN
jgi:hypothetical protein